MAFFHLASVIYAKYYLLDRVVILLWLTGYITRSGLIHLYISSNIIYILANSRDFVRFDPAIPWDDSNKTNL